MSNLILSNPTAIQQQEHLHRVGQFANQKAAENLISDYRNRIAENTRQAHDNSLALFRNALLETGVYVGDLLQPESWNGITWGLVSGFMERLLNSGYAVGTVNLALSSIKTYAKLAYKAGALEHGEYLKIKEVTGFSKKQVKHVNEQRDQTRLTRMVKTGNPGETVEKIIKKEKNIELSYRDRQRLKHEHQDTPQGRRDRVLMCIMLDHGLRCGEVALLDASGINLTDRTMTFYRPKVQKTQTIELSKNTFEALKAYSGAGDMPAIGKLLRGSRKGGKLTTNGMTERAITARVAELGCKIEKCGLSAHDCRHSWATEDYKKYRDIKRLQVLGGWNSIAMPSHYAHLAEIANEGASDLD